MQHDTHTCSRCGRPTRHDGATLCGDCLDALLEDLHQVDEIYGDLMVTRSKQDAIGQGTGRVSRSQQSQLGYRPGALAAAEELSSMLLFWAHTLAGEWEERLAREFCTVPGDGQACARWLIRMPTVLRYSCHAADLSDQIRNAVRRARAATDRPPERHYAGACSRCGADLYAREDATHIVCTGCRTTYRADQRYQELLAELRDRIATAADIASGIGRLAEAQLDRKTINKWHSRARLIARAHTASGDPMFRIGDVLDLARSRRERKVTARAGRGS